jgi:hypothetical protein
MKGDNFIFDFIYSGMVARISRSNIKSTAGLLLELGRIFGLLKRGRLGTCGFYIEFSKFLEKEENLSYFFMKFCFIMIFCILMGWSDFTIGLLKEG